MAASEKRSGDKVGGRKGMKRIGDKSGQDVPGHKDCEMQQESILTTSKVAGNNTNTSTSSTASSTPIMASAQNPSARAVPSATRSPTSVGLTALLTAAKILPCMVPASRMDGCNHAHPDSRTHVRRRPDVVMLSPPRSVAGSLETGYAAETSRHIGNRAVWHIADSRARTQQRETAPAEHRQLDPPLGTDATSRVALDDARRRSQRRWHRRYQSPEDRSLAQRGQSTSTSPRSPA